MPKMSAKYHGIAIILIPWAKPEMILERNKSRTACMFFIKYKNTIFDLMEGKIYDLKIVNEKIRNYCAIMDRCQHQVFQKLQKYGVSEHHSHDILIELIQQDFLNEERFAKSYSSGRFKIKKWGKRKIFYKLSLLKVSKECINSGLLEINDEEYSETLNSLAEQKYLALKDKNLFVRKRKVANYLVSKGYESELVWNKISSL